MPWYVLAADWARLPHSAVWESVRNYVKRFAGAAKDRLRGFDCYLPPPASLLGDCELETLKTLARGEG